MTTYIWIWMQLWITAASIIHQIGRVGRRYSAYMLTKVKYNDASDFRVFSNEDNHFLSFTAQRPSIPSFLTTSPRFSLEVNQSCTRSPSSWVCSFPVSTSKRSTLDSHVAVSHRGSANSRYALRTVHQEERRR